MVCQIVASSLFCHGTSQRCGTKHACSTGSLPRSQFQPSMWKHNHQQSGGWFACWLFCKYRAFFCVRFLGYLISVHLFNLFFADGIASSQRENKERLSILYNCSPLQDSSGLCIKRTYLSQPCTKCLYSCLN